MTSPPHRHPCRLLLVWRRLMLLVLVLVPSVLHVVASAAAASSNNHGVVKAARTAAAPTGSGSNRGPPSWLSLPSPAGGGVFGFRGGGGVGAQQRPLLLASVRRGGGGGGDNTVSGGGGNDNDVASGPIRNFVNTIKDSRRHLAAAAAARSTSIFAMYPVDTIKTRMQMEQSNPLRLAGIYKGVTGSLVGQVPYGVLTFGSYEAYKRSLLKRLPNVKPIFVYALSAVMGDLTGSGWLCPSEVVKQQMQAGMYPTTSLAVKGIWNKKGLVGFYEGYFGGVSRDVPFRVAQLTAYEVTKNLYIRMKKRRMSRRVVNSLKSKAAAAAAAGGRVELSPVDAAICGAVSGSFSAAVTSPLDRIKTLLMTDSAAYGGSVVSCAAKIWRDEGIKGFAQGLAPRVVYIAPSVVIFFIVYEEVQQRLVHWSTDS